MSVNKDSKDVIRDTDAEAIRLARKLVRMARYGALAVLEAETGVPLASRVGVATDLDGTPLILVSGLSAHTAAIMADPRCSLLLGEAGKGDALAHPRITLICRAARLQPGTQDDLRARRRYLNRNPKASLYIGLGDFSMFRLEPQRASLNGGFGKAYLLERRDLVLDGPVLDALADTEQGALEHMNADHLEAIEAIARHFARSAAKGWMMTGIDSEGIDLVAGDRTERVTFAKPLDEAGGIRTALVELTRQARAAAAPDPS